ncbi:Uncharacterised protein [Shewanella morhuae]|uniref:HTH-like domain-containing protein n=1 Tax=Shewanella morhuae TaxID=365591 RepID=A0A380A7J5_9GAMM|nr:Uncharacterised protein [Shewanella morhuae]
MIREVKKANLGFRMSELCRVFELSCSSLYYKPIPQSAEKQARIQLVEQAFSDSNSTYGKRRIQADLVDLDCKVGVYAIASIMKSMGLIAIRPKKSITILTQVMSKFTHLICSSGSLTLRRIILIGWVILPT